MRSTPGTGSPRLTAVPFTAIDGADVTDSQRRLAAEVTEVLSAATAATEAEAPLTLPLALSVCMQRRRADAAALVAAMRLARQTVLAVSPLDAAEEPAPLAAGEPRSAALGYASYLGGLLDRAAMATGSGREVIAAGVAAALA